MKKFPLVFGLLILSFSLSGCGLMEDAFKAGVIFAIIVVAIIALIIWLARMVAKYIIKKFDLSLDEDKEVIEKADESALIPQRIRIRNKV
jgi:Kef-type K+ transport system membrane component KefB